MMSANDGSLLMRPTDGIDSLPTALVRRVPEPVSCVPMDNYRIGFVGGGNMARSLLGGLIAGGVDPQRLAVSEPDAGKRGELAATFGVRVAQCEAPAVAVKPGQAWEVTLDAAGGVNIKRILDASDRERD